MAWMEREEILFRTLERYLVSEHLSNHMKDGFDGDVDSVAGYFLSMQNRRKSRAGQALENHVEQLLIDRAILYDRSGITENKSKPDFIFPGVKEYHDINYNVALLTMLGVKSTCKDRWRQVLTEANKITNKHLLTLEAAISENQTSEMQSQKLQLVIPRAIHNSYSAQQQNWLMTVTDFIHLVLTKQGAVSAC